MKIPERIIQGILNCVELLALHPLSAWDFVRRRDNHKILRELISGANMGFHRDNDDWRAVGKRLSSVIRRRFTK